MAQNTAKNLEEEEEEEEKKGKHKGTREKRVDISREMR